MIAYVISSIVAGNSSMSRRAAEIPSVFSAGADGPSSGAVVAVVGAETIVVTPGSGATMVVDSKT